MKYLLWTLLAWVGTTGFAAEPAEPAVPENIPGLPLETAATKSSEEKKASTVTMPGMPPLAPGEDGRLTFYMIPIRDQIAEPILYIVRNGVKEAIAAKADCVILDMNTPGGGLGVTLEIMEILSKFDGTTVTFVNTDAVSAGAFISAATDRIYFAPSGVIGAAAPVSGGGEDIDKTMKQKVVSYLRARVRSISEEHPYRGDVVSAMMDENFELKIDDVLIKPKGELLSLTAHEALAGYGDPPQSLLGAGIEEDLPALYKSLAGSAAFTVKEFQVSWSLNLALWLTRLSPLLLAAGGLLLFIEFKTPGFGVFGISGILLLVLVFFGHNVAGLSGHEPVLFFMLGVVLVFVEVMFLPGTFIPGMIGIVLMLGSLLWGMADIYPDEPIEFSSDLFLRPLANLFGGLLIAVVGGVVVLRFLPRGWFWDRMVLRNSVSGVTGSPASILDGDPRAVERSSDPVIGATGVAVTGLFPSGEVEVNHRRLQARVDVGTIPAGTRVRIVRRADFVYIVEPDK